MERSSAATEGVVRITRASRAFLFGASLTVAPISLLSCAPREIPAGADTRANAPPPPSGSASVRETGSQPGGFAGRAVTELSVLTGPSPRRELIGREARLTGVRVLEVVNDFAFWVGGAPERRLLVVRDVSRMPRIMTELPELKAGRAITLTGIVRKVPAGTRAARRWGLTAAQMAAVRREKLYLEATRISPYRLAGSGAGTAARLHPERRSEH